MTTPPEGPDPLLLEHMTWPEVELAITRGMTTAVVPVGSIEQHGPHLPLLVDAARGEALGRKVASALGDALVAPAIRVGCSEHHMGFAGTISLTSETLEAVCRDYATSLARHGFHEVYFVPSHGGNFDPLAQMVPRLQEAVDRVNPDCRVVAYTDLLGIVAVWRWVVEQEVGLGSRVGGHADIAESSEILHLHPELVRVERAEAGTVGVLDQTAVDLIFEKGFRAITANGILGDARGMDPDLGERLLDATARVVVAAFREEGGVALPAAAADEARGHPPIREETARQAADDLESEMLDDEFESLEELVEDEEEAALRSDFDDDYDSFDSGEVDLDELDEDDPDARAYFGDDLDLDDELDRL
jgi:creatinine amidohydrolase